jgi:hypothetical protein
MPRCGTRQVSQSGQASTGLQPGDSISRFGASSLAASIGLPFGLMRLDSFG